MSRYDPYQQAPDPYQQGGADPYRQGNPDPYRQAGPDPYQQAGPDPYRQPADPWGQGGAGGGHDSWGDPTRPQQPYADQPPPYAEQRTQSFGPAGPPAYPPAGGYWEEPPPPRRRLGTVVLVSVLVLLVAGGLGFALFWISGGDADRTAGGGDLPSAPATGDAGENGDGEDGGGGVPVDRIGMGAVVAQVDDCLINESTDDEPAMRIVSCDTDRDTLVYRVLLRVDEQVTGETEAEQDSAAHQICGDVEGYAYHYRFVGHTEADSFVLCMDTP
jgi:hypothetical protein